MRGGKGRRKSESKQQKLMTVLVFSSEQRLRPRTPRLPTGAAAGAHRDAVQNFHCEEALITMHSI